MNLDDMISLAIEAASNHGLDPALVCCVCHHESDGWNTWATRYESVFYNVYVMPLGKALRTYGKTASLATERIDRAKSFGLMQVMGQVAREYGFAGEYLTELCEPLIGLEFGCRKLKKCFSLAKGSTEDALLRYNGGGDKDYPKKVLKHFPNYKRLIEERRKS